MTITGSTRLAAVIGWPVEHSQSPALLNAAFAADRIDAVLVPIGVPPEGLSAVIAGLRAMRALGASVTLPHKVAVAALCDELSPDAAAIGAVNCLAFGDLTPQRIRVAASPGEAGACRLVGHNTDCHGFSDGLRTAGCDIRDRRALVLGTGGAARAVVYALRAARSVEVISRSPASWTPALSWTPDNLRASFARADLVVDCTSAGLDPTTDVAFTDALPLDNLPSGAWVATVVYHRRTSLLERASSLGHSTLDGRPMLIHQGARAFSIWTGTAAPVDVMARALDASLAR